MSRVRGLVGMDRNKKAFYDYHLRKLRCEIESMVFDRACIEYEKEAEERRRKSSTSTSIENQ